MTPTTLTDAQLGARAIDGDRDAFGELFARHERGLVEVAYRMTGSRDDAADIAQEAFLRVFARLDALGGREVDLAAYLHRTARNLVYDRSSRRAREMPVHDVERVAGADPGLGGDPERAGLVADQAAQVRSANARLPERHRLVLALRELEGMGYAGIGRVLDITPGAVAQLLVRARAGLRRELRLQQVDVAGMEPGCRARLADIAALVDGELDADRAHVLSGHMATCPACVAVREAFEDAGRRYRAWLPLPLVLGLGAETARAAESRELVRFSDTARRAAGAAGGGATGVPLRAWAGASRARLAGLLGGGAVAVALLVAVPVIVATRSGSTPPPAPAATPAAAAAPATRATTGSATEPPRTATTQTTTAQAAAAPPPAAPPPAPLPGAPPSAPASPGTTVAAPAAPATTTRTTPAPSRPRPPRPAPVVTVAGGPAAPPAGTTSAPAPVEPPPTGTAPTTDPPPSQDPPPPPTTTRDTPPDIPFPTTFPSLPVP